jgi:16S rRNA (guanine1516-N2)-methyltransferase
MFGPQSRITFANTPPMTDHISPSVSLATINGRLTATIESSPPVLVAADFIAGKSGFARRTRHSTASRDLLRAIGIRAQDKPLIFDAMAGLGRDGFAMAEAGCRVVMCERNQIIHALLADGLARAADSSETAEAASRVRLIHADAMDVLSKWPGLSGTSTPPAVVYLDPMYPGEHGSAAVKKHSQLLRLLAAQDPPESEPAILAAALALATSRVVVKRPKSAPWFADTKPNGTIASKSTRWDIHTPPGTRRP